MTAWAMSEKVMPGTVMSQDEAADAIISRASKEGCDLLAADILYGTGFKFHVVSNTEMQYGASAILYSGMLEKIRDKVGGEYYAIPSSVDEWLIVPVDANMATGGVSLEDFLFQSVLAVNSMEQFSDSFLADALYKYEDGRLACVRKK